MNAVCVFPGQGSQYVGMGHEFYHHASGVRQLFEEASSILDMDLCRLCFEDPDRILGQTEFVQPAITVVNLACLLAAGESGLVPVAVAGHSLGEYAALFCAGAFSFEDTLRLVRRRGQLMQQAASLYPGGMVAVMGLDITRCQELCEQACAVGSVEVANHNSPRQVILSGEKEALRVVSDYAKKAGAKLVVPLKVSGPWHSRFMQHAGEEMKDALTACPPKTPRIPVVSNVTGTFYETADQILTCLVRQMTVPVQWVVSIERLIQEGHRMFVEVGPGRVLSGLIRDISKDATVMNVEKLDDLRKIKAVAG
ncbi:MAG: ACP S-malonyltransferase [Nitrospira sp.]|nr:ACP S-malonyltransferase [Nitrospira sp.]